MDKEEVCHKRRIIKENSDKIRYYKSGSNKVYKPHICSVCGRVLTAYTPASKTPYKYTTDCIKCEYSGGISFYLCEHLRSCYRQLKIKE